MWVVLKTISGFVYVENKDNVESFEPKFDECGDVKSFEVVGFERDPECENGIQKFFLEVTHIYEFSKLHDALDYSIKLKRGEEID